MQTPLAAVIVASRAEFNVMRRGLETLRVLGVPYLFEVIAPHRSPDKLRDFARSAGGRGIEVIIATAGGSALLPSHIAANTTLPIIGIPVDTSPLRGQDALYSMTMMPEGIPIATVGINNSENAALLAVQILALKHPRFREVLAHRRVSGVQRSDALHKEVTSENPDLCMLERTAPLYHTHAPLTADGGISEAVTPEPPEEEMRIQPGAILTGRSSGPFARSLVSTPFPHEPGGETPENAKGYSAARSPIPPGAVTPHPHVPEPRNTEHETPPIRNEETHVSNVPETEVTATEDEEPEIHTKVFRVDRANINEDLMEHVMMVLLEGGIVGIPTDTVYGLSADATNEAAIERLMGVKGREHQKTLGFLIHHPDMLDQLVREVPPELERVIEECWPGALTIIFNKQPGVLSNVVKTNRIGIRIPGDEVCLNVLARIGRPIVMRNASIDPDDPIVTADPLIENYSGHIDCIVDAGSTGSETGASTVLSVSSDKFELLREGGVSREKLTELLGDKLK